MIIAMVNWSAAGVIITGTSILSTAAFWVIGRLYQSSTKDLIEKALDDKVLPRFDKQDAQIAELRTHDSTTDTRLARLEGVEEGKNLILNLQDQARKGLGDA